MPNSEKNDKNQKSTAKGKQMKRTVKSGSKPAKAAAKSQKSKPTKNEKTKKSSEKTTAERKKRVTNEGSRKKSSSSSNAKRGRKKPVKSVKIGFLGGLNEIGKNITVYEFEDDIVIVDCGLAFPEADMLGVDLVIPDFTYLEENREKIRGVVITHGHEDHIGSLAYLLQKINVPVYGTRLTMGLVEGKLEEHKLLSGAKLNVIKPGDTIKLGKFDIEAIHVNHSIPDALAFAVKCEAGVIVQMGDFKIDSTPIDGGMIDINRFAELGSEGVLCMLSDSTNAERKGYTESERAVGASLRTLFEQAGKRRIIIATFASNVHRVQQIIDQAEALGRKVALSGRSLENVVEIGSRLGYLNVKEGELVSIDMINKYPDDKIVIITTGSQGEPMSALSRMAFSGHKKVSIGPNDCIIISASPIPGNEKTVGNVINELMKLGADVIYEKQYGVHVSGHACQEELKLMMGIVKPKYFIPVHGEQKHIRKHAQLAVNMGIPRENVFIADNGLCLEISQSGIKQLENLPSGNVFVDGSGVGDVGNVVLRDRKKLAEDGLIIVVATMDSVTGEILAGPDIMSRGFVYVKESEELIEDAREIARYAIENCTYNNIFDWSTIKSRVRDEVAHLMYERTKRSPMILSIIMEV